MNRFLFGLFFVVAFISCTNKNNLDSTRVYFSVVDYLQGQVKQMDSLPLYFRKITVENSVPDTAEITKEEFHKYANEFLTIPDIASPKAMDDYSETNDFDEKLNNVLLMYTAKNKEDEVRSETIMMQPDESGNTHVKTILVNTVADDKDSFVGKNMTWHVGKRFQIVTKVNRPEQPEKINTVIITWE